MSIVTRLVLVATGVGALLIGVAGAWALRAEEAQLRASEQAEATLVGRAVAVAAENALRDAQLFDVVETITGLARVDPDLQLLLFGPGGNLVAQSEGAGAVEPALRALVALALTEGETAVRWSPPEDPVVLLLAEPLRDDEGVMVGAVVVRSPLAEMRHHLDAARRTIAGLIVVFVGVAGLTLWISARATIGRPLDDLLAAIRAVEGERLDVRLDARRRDELGVIAAAWNDMADALGEARERLAAEQEARRELTAAVAHADKLATMGQMTATIAHEVASPLQAVLGHAEQLVDHADDPERVRRHGGVVLRHTRRVIDVMQRMLGLVRRPVGHGRPYAARAVVDEVLELAALEARRRGVDVTVDEDDPPDVLGDPQELQQVVLNLVRNAVAASGPGGRVRLAMHGDEVALAPGLPPQPVLVLVVEDDGEGLPPGDPERLFEPFVTCRAEGGTGLGLAVVRGLVQARRGTVRAERGERGSRFVVRLPAAPPVAAAVQARRVP